MVNDMDDVIGKRVKVVGDHPHAGETGTIIEVKVTAFGVPGFVVKLEDCPHGIEECFVFKAANLQSVKTETRKHRLKGR